MALEAYHNKRKFEETPEPTGGQASDGQLRFVVQKHKASRLHYDFRLELDGAVPKGPSLSPADKRLAMMTEDHPMDYRLFEGTIPKGNYGAGTVMVWDEGTYTDAVGSADPETARKNLKAGFKKGDMKFILRGQKLRGSFVLVKIKGHDAEENTWLLIKHKDEFVTEDDVAAQDRSVLSGRTMDEITSGGGAQWLRAPLMDLAGAPVAPQPSSVKPMLATLADKPFDSPDWLYEVKWDGYRIIAHVKAGTVRLESRGSQDYTAVFAPICDELRDLKVDCTLDGEMVVVDQDGRSDFGALQNYQRSGKGHLVYYVFDAVHSAGHDLSSLPLTRRKDIASSIIAPLKNVRLSDHIVGQGSAFYELAQQQDLEGIIAKNADSPYLEGKRSPSWLKFKTHKRQEAVIGGWTEPRGGRQKMGALVLGVYGEGGELQYIGHTGGGFKDRQLKEMYDRLKPLKTPESPFAAEPKTNEPAHWVKPETVVEVKFSQWTGDGHLRHPVFLGVREDKDPRSVVREVAQAAQKVVDATPEPAPNNAITTKAQLTHPDKVFWPDEGITKGDLLRYYDSVAGFIVPYLTGRPESMNRHPNGINGKSFFHKDVESHPDFIRSVPLYSESNEQDINWLVCDDRDGLLYLVNLGCIELNPWHSRVDRPDHPDWCLIDLDAKTVGFDAVVATAQEVRKLLEELGVPSFPKTSGKTGLHVCIPLGGDYVYEQSRMLAELLVGMVQRRLPDLTSIDRNPKKREHKIYLDYLQNRRGQTMAAPYCVRPVPGAPVSTPLHWEEVRAGLDPRDFTIHTTAARLQQVGDLWQGVMGEGVDIRRLLDQLG